MRDIMGAFKQQKKLRGGLEKVDIEQAWKEVMGPGVIKYTTKLDFKDGTLYVNLSSSVMRQELAYGKSKIIAQLNRHLGVEKIQKLFLK